MTYTEATVYLEGLDILGMRFGTGRMHRLLAALDDPHRQHPAVHVVGSNGKTSTTLLAAALLEAHGHRSGAYVSPHIAEWTERIQVGGAPISRETFARCITHVRAAAEGVAPSTR